MLNGKHLIAGEWLGSASTFTSQPAHGSAHNFAVGTVVAVGAHESRRRLFFVVHDRCADSFYYVLLFLNHESKSSAIGMTYFAHLQDFLHTSGLNGDRQSVSRVEGGNITLAYNEKFAEMQSQIIEHLNKLGLLLNTL